MSRKKSPVSIAISGNSPIMDIDGIQERVAFIKVNKLFSRCVDALGVVNPERLKEVTRGIWVFDDVAKREKIQYLFSLYKGHIFGIYHVTGVSASIADSYRAGLPDFPSYPTDTRECDRWKAQFASVSAAKNVLTSPEFSRFTNSLTRPNVSIDRVLKLDRRRVYFSVDDVVPERLSAFVGCVIKRTAGLGGAILSDRIRPVIINF